MNCNAYSFLFVKLTLLSFFLTTSHFSVGHPLLPIETIRADCALPVATVDLKVNNVRAKLRVGGSIWWDDGGSAYVVPRLGAGNEDKEVSVIKAGGIWMGGFDPAGNLKIACQTDGIASGRTDFYAGPLNEYGITSQTECQNWDRFFSVTRAEVEEHLKRVDDQKYNQVPYLETDIPAGVKGWPARGNPHFEAVYGFALPDTRQGLALFYDRDGNGRYDPLEGDYPIINYHGCDRQRYADEMTFWIVNDAGGFHTESQGDAIQMEVQITAFSWKSILDVTNASYYHIKTINRAVESIVNFHFGIWMDPDLGCGEDDYIGCDPEEGLAYVYNADALDGDLNGNCGTTNTYMDHSPILALGQIRGWLDEVGNQMNMSSFTYYSASADNVPGNGKPQTPQEYYHVLTGNWADGTSMTRGGTGYNPGSTDITKFAFSDAPDNDLGWSMCSENLPAADQQFVYSVGPTRMDPGALNESIYSLQWVDRLAYPCPDIERLLIAEKKSRCKFDNCFYQLDTPDAPDVEIREGNQRLVMTLSNLHPFSNNYEEGYMKLSCEAEAAGAADPYYRFEGYQIYQLIDNTVSLTDYDNPAVSRLVKSMDLQNGVKEIYNWPVFGYPFIDSVTLTPRLMNPGATDQGLMDSIIITEDFFATTTDRRLVNNKTYYYSVIAYAHNNYAPFTFEDSLISGQHSPYESSRRNVQIYAAIPHLNSPDCGNPNNILNKKLSVRIAPNPMILGQQTPLRLIDIPTQATISIYDVYGRLFHSFEIQGEPCKDYNYNFQAQDLDKAKLQTGLYFIRIESPGYEGQTLKILLID